MKIESTILKQNLTPIDKAVNDVIITSFEKIEPYTVILQHPVKKDKKFICEGTINAITGKAGSRKTTFISMVAATASHNEKILWVDTEQTEQDIKYVYDKLLKQKANLNNITFAAFMNYDSIGENKPSYMELLENLIEKFKPKLVILDNVTDFDDSAVMELTKAVELARKISKIAKDKKLAFLNVVHANETKESHNIKGRGHIGSEFIRKSHVVINVEKATEKLKDEKTKKDIEIDIPNQSTVKFAKCRFEALEGLDFNFTVDKYNIPSLMHQEIKRAIKENKGVSLDLNI